MNALLLEDATSPAGTERLLNFGALGVIVLLFITGFIVTGRQYRKLEAKNDELQEYVVEHVLPLMERTTRALENNTAVLQRLIGPPTDARSAGLPLAKDDPAHPS